MVVVGYENRYGDMRTYIGIGARRNKQCGTIRKVSYVDLADTVRLAVRIHGSMRLREIVNHMSNQLKINLSAVEMKKALGGNVVEKQYYTDQQVLVVEDWVVV